MPTALTILVFLGSLALTLAAAGFFADRLDHVGARLGFPEAVVGLLTALAADAPEISSAVVALIRGEKEVSLGVVLGSNAFNLAAMIGLSALLTGAIRVERRALAVEGVVAVAATALAAAVLLTGLGAIAAAVFFAVVAGAYLVIASRSHERHHRHVREGAVWRSAVLIVPAVALVVVGATGMVRSALVLADRWHVAPAVVGVVVLAVLTSLPNALTAVRLAWAGRASALVTETFASNTINLVGGVIVPALAVGLAARTWLVDFNLSWVLLMSIATIALLARRSGLGRGGGALLLALYLAFVTVQLSHG